MEDTDLLICACHSIEHQIIIVPDDEFAIAYAQIHLQDYNSFWKRLIYGIKYIFGYKSRFGAWDEFIFDKSHIPDLKKLIKTLDKNELSCRL